MTPAAYGLSGAANSVSANPTEDKGANPPAVEVPPPVPDGVPITTPHPVPSPPPAAPEINDPLLPGQAEPVQEPEAASV